MTVVESNPTAFDKALDRLLDAVAACERGHLRDAIEQIGRARHILETEEQFREARKGNA